MKDLSNVATSALIEFYNLHAAAPVKKFRDRATAEARVLKLAEDEQLIITVTESGNIGATSAENVEGSFVPGAPSPEAEPAVSEDAPEMPSAEEMVELGSEAEPTAHEVAQTPEAEAVSAKVAEIETAPVATGETKPVQEHTAQGKLYDLIRRPEGCSMAELVKKLDKSKAAVSSLIQDLRHKKYNITKTKVDGTAGFIYKLIAE